jgi:aminoglycoside phosphotransferase (APT) family kinase protein
MERQHSAECERLAFMAVRLHEDEVRIDEDLVQQLLRTQMPDLANQDLHLVPAQGTDNVMFRLGQSSRCVTS